MVLEDVGRGFRNLVQQFGCPDVPMIYCGGNSISTMSLRNLKKGPMVELFGLKSN